MYHKNISSTTIISFLKSKVTIAVTLICLILTLGLGFYLRPFFTVNSAQAIGQPPLQIHDSLDGANSTSSKINRTIDNPTVENNGVDNTRTMGTSSSNPQTQEMDGVPLTVANFRFEQNQLMIDTCFDKPDSGDWIIWNASLQLGDKEVEYSASVPMEKPLDTTNPNDQRCDTIYFEGLSTETDFTNATFIVDWILAYPREGEECSSEYLAKYQKALDARNTGITVECFIEELKDGGMSGIRVANKPDSMGQEEAEAMIHNYDFFMELHGIQGPWIFTFSLK